MNNERDHRKTLERALNVTFDPPPPFRTIRVWLKRDSGQYWPSIYHTVSCKYAGGASGGGGEGGESYDVTKPFAARHSRRTSHFLFLPLAPCSCMSYHHDSRRIFIGQDNGAIVVSGYLYIYIYMWIFINI